ncbi:thiamine pyrophosphate-binding protein [Sneathiella sp. HT1-7]|uniref:thiamine pyrophosphate-binding protein n=1 Tax=Sneathiella sp. HT1-7 TaxID=2887192 RepID=UPI001D14E2A7|nr:thiamine pyrophosphate-binding protein [Sneathiella sp. HT1-7]MCC3305333.1 thiamine pyrophosphate-binding protein [Sneathiella sp. HT1-7]
MKLSSYVIDFLANKGVTQVFGMSGGAAVHLLDSVSKNPAIDFTCSQHEQSAAISADGYARLTGKLGVAITTSGPGATNLLTGTCCSFYDSVPTLMLTGQVASHRLKGNLDIRQRGFQETDVVSIFETVTKYAVQLKKPEDIRYCLEKAYHMAFEGRPGTVLIDIPDDFQRAEIDPETLVGFTPDPPPKPDLDAPVYKIMERFFAAERPAVILGGGLKTPECGHDIAALCEKLGAPVLSSWAAVDLLPHNHPFKIGSFGVYAPRIGNYVVQNADFLLCLGSRLSQNLTGGILPSFARAAEIAMIDISAGEMDKFDGFGISVKHRVAARMEDALPIIDSYAEKNHPDFEQWHGYIAQWKARFGGENYDPVPNPGTVNAYQFIDALSEFVPEKEAIFADTGGNLTWTCNAFQFKRGQRLHSAWNNTPMGYSLPAAIGAAAAEPDEAFTCLIGDGGLMVCLPELATVVKHQMKLRIFLFNNHGHGIQKQTLETWLGANYVGVHEPSGLAFTNFPAVASSMGLKTITIDDPAKMQAQLQEVYAEAGPVFVNVEINPEQRLYPVLKFGAALEDQLPALDDEVLEEEMVIPKYNG